MKEQLKTIREALEQAASTNPFGDRANFEAKKASGKAISALTQLEAMAESVDRDGWQLRNVYFQDGEPTMHTAPVAQQPGKPRKADVARTCPFCNEEWVEQPQAEAVPELTDSQIMASVGRNAGGPDTSISESRPLGQQWEQICALVRHIIRERYCGVTPQRAEAVPSDVVRDADLALDLLSKLFNAYENGLACYEDPDEQAGYVGNAVELDADTIHACADLLNRRRPIAAIAQQKGAGHE